MALPRPVSVPTRRHAPTEQARAAIAALGAADRQRLGRIAQMRSAPVPGLDWQDLLSEAFARILEGKRPWPFDVPLLAFVAQVMRSIASDRMRSAIQLPLRSGTSGKDDAAVWEGVADDAPLPGSALAAHQILAIIYGHFAGDDDVMTLLSGIEGDETAAETVRRTGIGHQAYDAARKRFGRGIERLLREGKIE